MEMVEQRGGVLNTGEEEDTHQPNSGCRPAYTRFGVCRAGADPGRDTLGSFLFFLLNPLLLPGLPPVERLFG